MDSRSVEKSEHAPEEVDDQILQRPQLNHPLPALVPMKFPNNGPKSVAVEQLETFQFRRGTTCNSSHVQNGGSCRVSPRIAANIFHPVPSRIAADILVNVGPKPLPQGPHFGLAGIGRGIPRPKAGSIHKT